MWVYIQTSSGPLLWAVGFFAPDNVWHPDREYADQDEAAERVNYLNGGTPKPSPYPPQLPGGKR